MLDLLLSDLIIFVLQHIASCVLFSWDVLLGSPSAPLGPYKLRLWYRFSRLIIELINFCLQFFDVVLLEVSSTALQHVIDAS